MTLAARYRDEGADELVFYDITASPDRRTVDRTWVNRIAAVLDIPFCVAGGIRSVGDAETVLNLGADKISVNSPALERPNLIDELVRRFGSQCVVIGVDTLTRDGDYEVYQYTGDPTRSRAAERRTLDWVREVQDRGAGEIVLNCMNQDGVRQGYDVAQLAAVRAICGVPLIASGGAGAREHFKDVFDRARVDGALAASVFPFGRDRHRRSQALSRGRGNRHSTRQLGGPVSETAFLSELQAIIRQRLADTPDGSYTARLASQGMLKVAQKLGEEGVELALAAAAQDQARVTAEAADLVYHLLLLLAMRELTLGDVVAELERRHRAA